MRALRAIFGIFVFCVLPAFACDQIGEPRLSIQANVIGGKATLDNKPIAGAEFQLFRVYEGAKKLIRKTKANNAGQFDFGRVEAGTYEIRMISPSGERVEVSVRPPTSRTMDRVHMKFFADFCHAYETYN